MDGIISMSTVPVGCIEENGSEARNKYYKSERLFHARQNSRKHNLTDIFNTAKDSSDPLLTSVRMMRSRSWKHPYAVGAISNTAAGIAP